MKNFNFFWPVVVGTVAWVKLASSRWPMAFYTRRGPRAAQWWRVASRANRERAESPAELVGALAHACPRPAHQTRRPSNLSQLASHRAHCTALSPELIASRRWCPRTFDCPAPSGEFHPPSRRWRRNCPGCRPGHVTRSLFSPALWSTSPAPVTGPPTLRESKRIIHSLI